MLDASIAEIGACYRSGRLSPVDVVRACLDRIAALDGSLNAFITVLADDGSNPPTGMSVTVTRDTTDPEVTILSPSQNATVCVSPISVSIQVTDLTATQVVFGANSISLPAGGGTAVGDVDLVEGPNAIAITVTDAAGRITPETLNVTLDTNAPMVTINSPAMGAASDRAPPPSR